MSAAEVLAELLEIRFGTTTTWAQHILDALKADGYAVVELPKPERTEKNYINPEQGPLQYFYDHDVCAYPGGVMDVDADLSPGAARSLAATLLAAADAAEAS